MMPDSDIKIKNVTVDFAPAVFRTPLKFGSGQITDVTLATASAEVESRNGKTAAGRGAILLSDLWA